MKNLKFLVLSILISTSSAAFAGHCYQTITNTEELADIVSFTIEDLNQVTDTSIEQFRVQEIKYNPCHNFKKFIISGIELKAKEYGFETSYSYGKVRDYSGSFHKEYSFDNFVRPTINFEKQFHLYISNLSEGRSLSWKYIYFYNSDGSTNSETGAILYNKHMKKAFRISILVLP